MSTQAAQPETPRTSRLGKRPIDLPKGVQFTSANGRVEVKGAKGTMSRQLATSVTFQVESGKIHVTCAALGSDGPRLQGLSRALVASMVKGVSDGYERVLELKGTGYRVEQKGNVLHFALGFSHPIQFPLPDGVKAAIPADSKGTVLILTSADKELIGQTAAVIRGFRPPEPYGGKGVRYRGEKVREKAGKAGKGGKK